MQQILGLPSDEHKQEHFNVEGKPTPECDTVTYKEGGLDVSTYPTHDLVVTLIVT